MAGAERLSDESFRVVADTASDAIVTVDEEGQIHFVNAAAERIFGYSTAEMRGAPLTMLMPDHLRHQHRAGLRRYIETGHRQIEWRCVELPGLHKSSREMSLEISYGEFVEGGKRFFTGIIRDISARKRAERRLAAQHAVTSILAESATLGEAAPRVLRAICESLGWDTGALWSVDREAGALRWVESWQSSSVAVAEFTALSRRTTFAPGEGLPGRVWWKGAPLWLADVCADDNFPRAAVAAQEGLHGAFACPVKLEREVLGVMEFFSREICEPDDELLDMLGSVGGQTGQFIERKRIEENLRWARRELEWRVEQRTTELVTANALLKDEIAERRRVEAELQRSEAQHRAIVEDQTELICRFLPNYTLTFVNEAYCRYFGSRRAELLGMSFLELLPDAERETVRKHLSTLRRDNPVSTHEHRVTAPGGEIRWQQWTNRALLDEQGRVVEFQAVGRDITEHKLEKEERMRLLQRLVTAQEDERQRIARELHDQTGQYLAALLMGLKALENLTAPASLARGSVGKLQALAARFSQDARRLALELRPTALDDLGLHAALTNYVDEWSERSGITIDFHSNGLINRRLPQHIETALYRVIQETLNNVLKHARAGRVSVILENRGGRVLAVLEDDGVGFDVEAALGAPIVERRLGLTGMRERIEAVGGTLEIESAPGVGTTIVARIHVPSRGEESAPT